jgi:hypothetical protein
MWKGIFLPIHIPPPLVWSYWSFIYGYDVLVTQRWVVTTFFSSYVPFKKYHPLKNIFMRLLYFKNAGISILSFCIHWFVRIGLVEGLIQQLITNKHMLNVFLVHGKSHTSAMEDTSPIATIKNHPMIRGFRIGSWKVSLKKKRKVIAENGLLLWWSLCKFSS